MVSAWLLQTTDAMVAVSAVFLEGCGSGLGPAANHNEVKQPLGTCSPPPCATQAEM